ncbi:unnamed protein product [Rhizophagus irregularis]|nr:unnamed protein product [Rhizophagus irregularis]CAB4421180.1 unnamed protein product [Rhizophagus irregularis]CAB4423288.1 unnamed protein product [Rhizophagus irregularis]CAB4444175.1 unnamed protein product [Rhizophagus irregularis]
MSSKFTRITMSSRLRGQILCPQNLRGQQCPQDYEDKHVLKTYKDNNVLKITRTKCPQIYKGNNALKIMRTKMSSNLLRQ